MAKGSAYQTIDLLKLLYKGGDFVNWIYEKSSDNSIRYVLGTKGKKTLFCFGINPSTAEPNKLDPTLKNVEKIALNNGYDSWVMFNVYPKRDTFFENLSNVCNDLVHIENIKNIKSILDNSESIDIWVAFGDHIYDREYLTQCWMDIYNKIKDYNINWLATGKNNSGAPKHPLYQKSTTKLYCFDMVDYIKNL